MKKSQLAIVAAAAFAIGGMSTAWGQDRDIGDRTTDAGAGIRERTAETIGIGSADQASQEQSPNAEAIHDVMAQVVEAAFTKDGLDDMVERFVDADRNRLGQNDDALKSDETLNGRIAQLQDDWKAKYGDEFNIKDEDKVYNLQFARISEGEIGDAARTAGERITDDAAPRTDLDATRRDDATPRVDADARVDTETGTARVDVDNNTGLDRPRVDTGGQTAADRNLNDPGRNVATVRIAESHGLPALDVPMMHEAGGWKLDIPDHVDAMKFKENVLTALTDIGEKKAQWSADEEEAYRHTTHRVLLAVYDKEPGAGADFNQGLNQGLNQPGADQNRANQQNTAQPQPQ